MDRSITVKRRFILVGVSTLLLADLALAGYSWHMATALRTTMAQVTSDANKLKLLTADI